jgi:hypothetical protein
MSKCIQHSNKSLNEIGRIPKGLGLIPASNIAQIIVSNVDKKFEEKKPQYYYETKWMFTNDILQESGIMRGSASKRNQQVLTSTRDVSRIRNLRLQKILPVRHFVTDEIRKSDLRLSSGNMRT